MTKDIKNRETEQKDALQKKNETIRMQRQKIQELETDKRDAHRLQRAKEKEIEQLEKERRRLQNRMEEIEHEKRIRERLAHYQETASDCKVVEVLHRLWNGEQEYVMPLSAEEFLKQLGELLEKERPGTSSRIADLTGNMTKCIICHLLLLGFDDKEMWKRAQPHISDKTLRNYGKECLELMARVFSET